MKKILIGLFVLIGTVSYSQNSESNTDAGGATLYINRPNSFVGVLANIEVLVNGVAIKKMSNNSTYQYIFANTGKAVIRVEACGLNKSVCSPDELTINVEKGKYYFAQVKWGFYNVGGPQQLNINQVAYEEVSNKFPGLESYVDSQKSAPATAPASDTNVNKEASAPVASVKENTTVAKSDVPSDVDINIPENATKQPYRFALIIGNEDYSSFQSGLSSEVNVAYAVNDAKTFKEYANRTLGIPEDNTILLLNARAVEMNRAINKMNLYAKNSSGKAEFYVFYAGHGFPDEVTKEPYLMPVDVSGSDLQFAVKLNDLYKKMTEYKTQNVTIFLDACFSGGGRNQGLVAARGVKVKPKETVLNGNLVVFASSSGDQSSLPYKDKQHGMFTYYLLKKIKESKGHVSYKDLSNYVSEQVVLNSIRVNDKEQNPQLNCSPEVQNLWENWTFYK
jgi:hypothetical protein